MKQLEMSSFGVLEMQQEEMENTDGGFLPLIIIGCALLLGGCQSNYSSGNNNNQSNGSKVDSSKASAHGHLHLQK